MKPARKTLIRAVRYKRGSLSTPINNVWRCRYCGFEAALMAIQALKQPEQ